jgi:putative ABC transport system permease protein
MMPAEQGGGGRPELSAEIVLRIEEVVRRSRLQGSDRADVRDELVAHFEDGLAAGRTAQELLAAFGDATTSARWIGEERGAVGAGGAWSRVGVWIGSLGRDFRIAFRRFRGNPGFVLTAVLSLAIGIGANAAIFTLVNAIIVRDLPYAEPENLYDLYMSSTGQQWNTLTYPDVRDVREAVAGVADAVTATQFTIVQAERSGLSRLEMLPAEMVNGDYFGGLGIRPALGRLLGPEDDVAPGAHPVVVLGWNYWQSAFSGDRGVVGRTIDLSGRPYTIIGVAPREFPGTLRGLVPAFFAPILMQRELGLADDDPFTERSNHAIFSKIRLKPGVPRQALESVLATLADDLRKRGEWIDDSRFDLVQTSKILLFPPIDGFIRAAAWMMSGVVALVLLIACANLASFLLAKAVDRRREIAVQLSLGATRGTLIRQLLIETIVLSVVAGVAGVLASVVAMRALVNADLPLPIPITLDLSPDRVVVMYSLLVSTVAGIAFGLAPALQSTRTNLAEVLRDETAGGGRRGRSRLRGVLVAVQVAVSLVLLLIAGLLLRSFQATQSIDPGFGAKPTAIVQLGLRADRWNEDQGLAFSDRLHDRFLEVPGVTGVAFTGRLHLDPLNTWNNNIIVDGVAPPPGADSWLVDWTPVTPDFFDVMGIRIVSGRAFNSTDRKDASPVAIVSQAMARQFWPGRDPVGETFRFRAGKEFTIVGVSSDAKVRNLGEPPRAQYYRPFAQAYVSGFSVVANTSRDAEATAIQLANAAREMDSDVFTWEPKSMARHLATQLIARRLAAWIVSAFAVLALVLASIGLYGLVSYAVSQRRREVGIRMSLGAGRGAIIRLLLVDGLRLVVVGLFLGLAASFALARLLGGLLYGIRAIDAPTFTVVPLLLFGVAFTAAFVPALRATRLDPGSALRAD